MTNLGNIMGMRTGSGEERESALQSGWTVEAAPDVSGPAAPERSERLGSRTDHGAGDAPAAPATGDAAPVSDTVAPADAATEAAAASDAAAAGPAQMSNLTVVLLGLTGGLFALFAWVWMSWAQYYADVNAAAAAGSGSIGGVLQQIVFWIAPLAPVAWFVAALALTRHQPRKLTVALVVGLIVTFPLPMIFQSGAAL